MRSMTDEGLLIAGCKNQYGLRAATSGGWPTHNPLRRAVLHREGFYTYTPNSVSPSRNASSSAATGSGRTSFSTTAPDRKSR